MTRLVVYGDFNCPFSRLASARLAALEHAGEVTVDWRAVEHDRSLPKTGQPVEGEVAEELERELGVIRRLLAPGEPDPLRLPSRRVNTEAATLAYAAAPDDQRPLLRESLFRAYWQEDGPIDDASTLAGMGLDGQDPETAARWREEFLALPQQIVPTMIRSDGSVLPGLEALAELAPKS